MDVRDDSTASNGRLDQGVQLLVSSDGQLQVSRRDSLHLQVLGSVTCKLEDLSSEVLKDGSTVDSGRGSNSAVSTDSALEESVDSSNWELQNIITVKHDHNLLKAQKTQAQAANLKKRLRC